MSRAVTSMLKLAVACVFWVVVGATGSLALVPVACFWLLWGVTDQFRE